MATERRLRIGSLNVWNPGGPGREDALANLMRQADVVLLQELRDLRQLADLARRAGLPYYWGSGDVGIASRFVLEGFQAYWAYRVPQFFPVRQWLNWKYTPFCSARLVLDGRTVHVLSNHWSHNSDRWRMDSATMAMKALTALPQDDVVFFGGDFNAVPELRELQVLRQLGLVDTFSCLQGCEHAGPRIDQLFYRGGVSGVLRYEARGHVEPAPTDHPFLLVELSLPGTGPDTPRAELTPPGASRKQGA